jgi:CDP-diacylglycerol--glycerol-3-phosphate 3-phosphatidyltransferase
MWLIISKDTYIFKSDAFPVGFPLIGLLVLLLAATTDVFDGMIARKFNQITEWGKMIDPVADKLMHSLTALALAIAGHLHWAFFIVLVAKEVFMVVWGVYLLSNSRIIQANMLGKVASTAISIGVFMTFFHDFFAKKVFYLDWIIVGIGILLTYMAFANYCYQAIKIILEIVREKKKGSLNIDTSGETTGENTEKKD